MQANPGCKRKSNPCDAYSPPTPALVPPPPQSGRQYDSRVDLIKVVASFGVVLVHTSMYALGEAAHTNSFAWWLANLGNALGRNASSLFVMVAGAILLARQIELAPAQFLRTRLSRIVPAIVFWSAFYIAWRQWKGEELTVAAALHLVQTGVPYFHLWFLYVFACLYVLMPAARLLFRPDTPPAVAKGLLVATMVYAWLAVTELAFEQRWPTSFVPLTPLLFPYLLAGHMLYHRAGTVGSRDILSIAAIAAAALLCIVILVGWLYPGANPREAALAQGLRVPLTFAWTFSVFTLLLHVRPAGTGLRLVRTVGPVTLGIYAIHPFWIDMMAHIGWPIKPLNVDWIGQAVVVYLLSAVTSLLMSQVAGLRRVVL